MTAYNTNFSDLRSNTAQVGANTLINLGNGNSITLLNFTATNLEESDFIGLGASPPTPNLFLTGIVDFSTDSAGNISGGQGWNTLSGDPPHDLWVIQGDNLNGTFVNSSGASISIPLSAGETTFTLYGNPGNTQFFSFSGLNLFFNGNNNNPGISVFTPVSTSNVLPGFPSVNSSPLTINLGFTTIVPASGSAIFSLGDKRVELTSYGWYTPSVFAQDRVQAYALAPGAGYDFIGKFTLRVGTASSVPTEGDDTLYGTPGNDTIDALGGNDLIFGLGANDSLIGGTGNDTIDPGLGNDTVDGGDGTDLLTVDYSSLTTDISSTNSGTSGTISTTDNSVNYSSIEQMNLSGGSGNDTLVGTSGGDTLSGNGGEDYMVGGEGDDSLDGGAGNDTLDGGSGNNTLNGGAGGDAIAVSGSGTVFGGDGNDTFIFYGPFTGIIDGGGGSDSIFIAPTYPGDIIFPGAPGTPGAISGIETIAVQSSSGNDYLIGGDGNDSLDGQGGNDTLDSKGGNDTLLGGTGNDVLKPGLGTDTVDGGAGDDLLVVDYASLSTDVSSSHNNGSGSISTTDNRVDYANIERLSLTTGSGNDVLAGTSGNDTLIAGNGNDSLFGGVGNDSLDGGDGNDTLVGANPTSTNPGLAEIDTLAGGAGSDLFILGDSTWQAYDDRNAATNGTNDYAIITGFNSSDGDTIQLQGPKSKYLLETSGSDTRLLILEFRLKSGKKQPAIAD